MKITLNRIFLGESYTIGHLFIDGIYFCDTLEDKVRDPGVKIKNETAIPEGKYRIIINFSPRFKRELPRLLDVPMFDGILIHPGNTKEDTSGCICVGKNKIKGKLVDSKTTFEDLFKILRSEKEEIYIDIHNH